MAQKKNAETFETAMERLDQLAARMEGGELPLEELLAAYEEGLRLVRFCSERLDEAEKRLEAITRNAAGQPQGLAPVDSPEEIPPSTPPPASGRKEDSSGTAAPSGPGPVRLF